MKKLVYFIFAPFLFLTFVVVFLPRGLSTDFGKRFLTHLISFDGKEIEAKALSLRWFGPQEVSGLTYSDPTQGLTIHVRKATTTTELWHLFLKKKNLKSVLITDPFLKLTQLPSKQKGISSPLKVNEGPTSKTVLKTIRKKTPFPFKGTITVEKGSIEVSVPQAEMIKFFDIDMHLALPSYSSPEKMTFSCASFQNNVYGKAHFNAKLNKDGEIEIKAHAKELPIVGIDNLLALEFPQTKGLLIQSIGASLDFELDGHLSKHSFELSLSASSQKLLAELHTKKEAGMITFLTPASFSITLSPELLERLVHFAHLPRLSFQEQSQLNLKISHFLLPMNDDGLGIKSCGVDAELSLSPTRFTIPRLEKTIDLTHFTANLASKNLRDLLHANLEFKFSHLEKEGSVTLSSNIASLTKGHADVSIHHFPTALLDKKHYLALFLGNTIDLTLQSEWDKALSSVRFCLQTPFLKIPQTILSLNNDLVLESPITLSYHPPRSVFDFLQLHQPLPIQAISLVNFSLEELKIPNLSNWQSLHLKGELNASDLSWNRLPLPTLSAHIDIASLENIHVEVESPILQTEVFAAIPPPFTSLAIKKTIHLKTLITDDFFYSLLSPPLPHPHLESPTLCHISIDPFSFPLVAGGSASLLIKAIGSTHQITFINPHQQISSSFKDVSFKFWADQKNKQLSFDLSAKALVGKKNAGSVDLSFLCDQTLSGKGRIKNLSTEVIQTLWNLDKPLLPVLGPSLDLTFEIDEKENQTHYFVDVNSDYLKTTSSFLLKDREIVLNKDTTKLEWTLTPEGLNLLDKLLLSDKHPPFTLQKNAHIKLNLLSLLLSPSLDLAQIEGDFLVSTLSLQDREKKETLTLKELKGSVSKESNAPLKFSLHGKAAPQGELDIVGTLLRNPSFTQLTSDLDCAIRQFPTPFLDLFSRPLLQTDLHLRSLLGDKVNATLTAQIENNSGKIHLAIHSDNAKAALDGTLTNGILSLTAPLHAQFQITPEFSTLLLKKVNPLSITSFSSKDPVTLRISSKEFFLPLFPLNFNQALIPSARLELGKITCGNRGNLKSILKLLKSSPSDKTLELWFTPLDLHIRQGVVHVERTDILIENTLPIALWGIIDFPSDTVNMTLGLTKQTLLKAFHIKKLPDTYVLHIPLRGPTKDVSFDKVKATTKIATLMAWQCTSKGKSQGTVWDELLGSVATLPNQDKPTPPPKKPLPWDKKQKSPKKMKKKASTRKQPKIADKKPLRKNSNPLKELFKAIK